MARRELKPNWNRKHLDDQNEMYKELYNGFSQTSFDLIQAKKEAEDAKKLNQLSFDTVEAIKDIADKSKKNSEEAKGISINANVIAKDTNDRMNEIISQSTNSSEIIEARKTFNETPSKTLAERLNKDFDSVRNLKGNLFFNSDFQYEPQIEYRNDIYKHELKKLDCLIIKSESYSTITSSDFSFILKEPIAPGEVLSIKMSFEYTGEPKKISFRMAGNKENIFNVSEGENNNILFEFENPETSYTSTRLYVDFLGNASLKIKQIHIQTNEIDNAKSIADIYRRIRRQRFDIKNDSSSINNLIDVAKTYQKNIDKFVYGNFNTAYDQEIKEIDGKFEIDCSSFVSLLLEGVTFEKSRYENSDLISNIVSNDGYIGINPYKYRYSGEMAKYLYDNGYTIVPNSELTNIEKGDLVFFSWEQNYNDGDDVFRERSFMGIQHVGIFLGKKTDDTYRMLQIDNNFTTTFYTTGLKFMKQSVLIARVPLKRKENIVKNLVKLPNNKYRSIDSTAAKVELLEPIKKDEYYTVFIKGSTVNPNHYFIAMNDNYKVLESGPSYNEKTGFFEFRFYNKLDDSIKLMIGVGDKLNSGNDRPSEIEAVYIYEGFVGEPILEEFDIVYDLGIKETVLNNTWPGANPYQYYTLDRNRMLIEVNLPLKDALVGNNVVGEIPDKTHVPSLPKRIPVHLKEKATQLPMFGMLFISNGKLIIEPQEKNKPFDHIMIDATISI